MPKMSGIEAVKNIIASSIPGAKIVMCSALGQEALVMEALKAGAIGLHRQALQGRTRSSSPFARRSRSRSRLGWIWAKYRALFLEEAHGTPGRNESFPAGAGEGSGCGRGHRDRVPHGRIPSRAWPPRWTTPPFRPSSSHRLEDRMEARALQPAASDGAWTICLSCSAASKRPSKRLVAGVRPDGRSASRGSRAAARPWSPLPKRTSTGKKAPELGGAEPPARPTAQDAPAVPTPPDPRAETRAGRDHVGAQDAPAAPSPPDPVRGPHRSPCLRPRCECVPRRWTASCPPWVR